MHGQHHGPHALHGFDHRRELHEHLRQEHIQLIEVCSTRSFSLSLITSTPSSVSNMDLSEKQIGMS